MARTDKVAARYARAIYGLVGGSGGDVEKARAIVRELEPFAKALEGEVAAQRLLSSQALSDKQRRAFTEDLASRGSLSELARRVLLVLSDSKRLGQLPAVVEQLNRMLLASSGVVPLDVVAAVPLSPEERQKVEGRFSQILGKKVEASYRVDPTLIGGLRVTAGSRTFDGTVAGWLNKFRDQLVGGTI